MATLNWMLLKKNVFSKWMTSMWFCDFCRTKSLATDNWTFSIDFIASKSTDMLRSLYLAIDQLETNELNLEYFDCCRVRTASQFQVHDWRQISHQLRKISSKNSRVERVWWWNAIYCAEGSAIRKLCQRQWYAKKISNFNLLSTRRPRSLSK